MSTCRSALQQIYLITDRAVHLVLVQLLAIAASPCILLSVFKLLLVESEAAADAARDISCTLVTLQTSTAWSP